MWAITEGADKACGQFSNNYSNERSNMDYRQCIQRSSCVWWISLICYCLQEKKSVSILWQLLELKTMWHCIAQGFLWTDHRWAGDELSRQDVTFTHAKWGLLSSVCPSFPCFHSVSPFFCNYILDWPTLKHSNWERVRKTLLSLLCSKEKQKPQKTKTVGNLGTEGKCWKKKGSLAFHLIINSSSLTNYNCLSKTAKIRETIEPPSLWKKERVFLRCWRVFGNTYTTKTNSVTLCSSAANVYTVYFSP